MLGYPSLYMCAVRFGGGPDRRHGGYSQLSELRCGYEIGKGGLV